MPILILLFLLLAPPPIEPPIVTWHDDTHVLITWEQGASDWRCFEKEEQPPIDYGCVWSFQGSERAILPPPRMASSIEPGDTILMDGQPIVVPAHSLRIYLPVLMRECAFCNSGP